MSTKSKLKERLLEIPIRYRAFREYHTLANYINETDDKVKPYLDELCELGILEEKIEYVCPRCHETFILTKELLIDFSDDNGILICDSCEEEINSNSDTTGFIYYDVLDMELLKKW